MSMSNGQLEQLAARLDGELHTGDMMRRIYSTDASAYQEMPLAVSIPKSHDDLVNLVRFAAENSIGLIPRTAGTSLAGQVVGSGIVVDVSRNFTEIIEINAEEQWVRVQPGVIRNELNRALQPDGVLFGPETSTQNRAMVGGMLGNNSCGSNSIKYGSVRDHVLEVKAILSDGSLATFGSLTSEQFQEKCDGPPTLETQLYQDIRDMLSDPSNRNEIAAEFPKPTIPRRNTGYALDMLMDASALDPSSEQLFNFGKLIAGSEGTLCLVTEMKLHCDRLPAPVVGLQCAHFETVDQALRATQLVVEFDCYACELIDRFILECTRRSLEHRANRFFIQGDPGAILVTEIRGESEEEVLAVTDKIEAKLRGENLGSAYPVLFGADTIRIWNLRKAGLGLLSNTPGDEKPAPVIEDTAVDVDDLPDYIAEFNRRLQDRFGLECVHYAHAGSGEIHLRPILNLKTKEGNRMFRDVAQTVADLVKEYRGSLSGEHGDGRLRGEFLQQMIGEKNYGLVARTKKVWDPKGVFNPGKIVDTPPMNSSLRFNPGQETRRLDTHFDWSSTQGMLRAAELCNGSGDCRKTHLAGGTMCPSYMATKNEKDTTRARANTLRNVLTNSPKENPFDDEDLKDVLDLCLSCKGCKSECPTTVDMAKLKAEFLQHYYDANGTPKRAKLIAQFSKSQRLASRAPWLWNLFFGTRFIRRLLNRAVGFHPDRSIPLLPKMTFEKWFLQHHPPSQARKMGRVWVLNDEITNHNDVEIGIKTVELLERLGYEVEVPESPQGGLCWESGRTWISKGLVREAKAIFNDNVRLLAKSVSEEQPMIGAEPSTLLGYRDESIDLAPLELKEAAQSLSRNCLMVEEFIAREMEAGRITSDSFSDEVQKIKLHGHCFQKALASVESSVTALSLPENYSVEVIPSGCCGMAGFFCC